MSSRPGSTRAQPAPSYTRADNARDVQIKRIYDAPEAGDGYRVLIDHVWPRGVTRANARLDEWARALAPSDGLRTWFSHIPERFDEFRIRYRRELATHPELLEKLDQQARTRRLTILYAARDREHNNAVVLAELLRDGLTGHDPRRDHQYRERDRQAAPPAVGSAERS